MTFPGNVNRYVVSGYLAGGERWSVGFYGEATLAGTAQTLADGFASSGNLSNSMLLQWLKLLTPQGGIDRVDVYVYGSGRTLIDQGTRALTGLVGTGTDAHGNRTCLVVTLRTATFGARGRGRFYLPAVGYPITAGALFQQTGTQAIVDATAAGLGFLNARVVSEADSASREVTRLTVDLIPDTQRSRSDSMTSPTLSATVT